MFTTCFSRSCVPCIDRLEWNSFAGKVVSRSEPVNLPPLAEFIELVKATDEDVDHRLPLVSQASPILYGGAECSETEREFLAEKFERWRYQRLNKFGSRLSDNERQLVALLDIAGKKILRNSLPPKSTRSAISSAAMPADSLLDSHASLEELTGEAAAITAKHFSFEPRAARTSELSDSMRRWRMRLYAPLYLSNHCVNHCLYCAFRFPNKLERVHLTCEPAMVEAEVLRAQGHRHLLVVAGDFPKLTSIDYLTEIVGQLAAAGLDVSVEVAPQSTMAYKKLVRAGATGITLYQETYQEQSYYRLHPRGPKVWFDWRLEALERAAEAGMKRLGLGILLGLADPALDLRCLIRHGQYLRERFPEVKLAFSLPRIHEAPDDFTPDYAVDDDTFIKLYCALRITFPEADLVLSTREPPALRDLLANICITQMSAGSCTAPGGYSALESSSESREQFPVFDHRPTSEIAASLERSGFQIQWEINS